MGQAQNMLLFEAEKRKDAAFKQRTRSRENEQKALLTHNSSPATAYLLLNTKITKMHSLPFSVPSDAWLHFAGRCLGFKSFIRQRLLFVAAARGDRGWQRGELGHTATNEDWHSCSRAPPHELIPWQSNQDDIMVPPSSLQQEPACFSWAQEKLASVFLAVPEEMAFYSKVSWETEHIA